MRVLGIHDGHNASAALVEDGELVFALQEERPRNIKNFNGFPEESIAALLGERRLGANDIDVVALSSRYMDGPSTTEELLAYFGRQGTPLTITLKKISKLRVVQRWRERQSLARRFAVLDRLGFPREKVNIIEHHLCHAGAAYYGLGKDAKKQYLVLTLDGGGDWLCSTVSVAREGKIERIASTAYGHSVGDLYSRTTYYMGMTPWEHEYKLMGLAPYASEKYSRKAAKIYETYLDLDLRNPLVFKRKVFEDTNHILGRLRHDLRRERFDSVAGGLQMFTEELIVRWIRAAIKETGIRDILCGGGVFMNVKANKLIAELPEVASMAVFPSCGDESNSIGAAWAAYYEKSSASHAPHLLKHCYLGTSFPDDAAMDAVRGAERAGAIRVGCEANINRRIAELLAEGKIVARATGPVEFGARALGNRSIFADPKNQNVVPVINTMIKNRDFWMPFAPIVLADRAGRYLINPKKLSSPYMMMAFDTPKAVRDEIIAAIHPADGSARAEILEPGQNPDVEEILREFERATGRAMLLNTSFNLHGSPIVYGPEEALWTFLNSGLEYLALGTFLVTKR